MLARLLHTFSNRTDEGAASWRVVADGLFQETVRHARANTRFYAERFAGLPAEVTLADLDRVPSTSRDDITRRFNDVIASDCQFAFASHTSGTTTGAFLEVYRSHEEVAFVQEFLTTLATLERQPGAPAPLVLAFPIAHHGVAMPVPSAGRVFAAGVTDDNLLRDAVRTLTSEHDIPGHERTISILSAPLYQLTFFTSYLHEIGFDWDSSRVTRLYTYGQLMTPSVREFLESSWRAPVTDRYSSTEILGGATSCPSCAGYHFDDFLIPEIVDPDGKEPTRGTGSLLLTALYPFVRMQPMIRYDTGDVFTVQDGCERVQAPSFFFEGRRQGCVFVGDRGARTLAFSSAASYAALDDLPDIARSEWFGDVSVAHDRTAGSLMKVHTDYDVEGAAGVILLRLELRYSPHLFPDRAAELRSIVMAHLREANERLADHLASGAIQIDLHLDPPGSHPPRPQKI